MVHVHVKMSRYGHVQKRESVSVKTQKKRPNSQTRIRAIARTRKNTITLSR